MNKVPLPVPLRKRKEMGGVTSSMAAKLAFFPPNPPLYTLQRSPSTGLMAFDIFPQRDNVEIMKVNTRRGNVIVAVYVRNEMATSTILYSHGNAADLGQMYELFIQLSIHLRVNIMGYDYSGYGQSTGKPSEKNTYADIEAVYKCLKENFGAREEDIILYGQSVGSGPTLDLAIRVHRLGAVILHSPILSGLRVMYPVKHSYWFDIYKNVDKISLVNCPVLVIHGTSDEVVNFSHGKQLWKLSKEKYEPLWLKGGNHCDLELFPQFIQHLSKFILSVEKQTILERNCWRKSRDRLDISRRSTDCFEASRRSMDHRRQKARPSVDSRTTGKDFHMFGMEKLERIKMPFQFPEKSRSMSSN